MVGSGINVLSILTGQRGSELVGGALWEGQRWLCRAGTKEREQKDLRGRDDQSHHSPPVSALLFPFTCRQPGRSPLNQEWPKSCRKAAPREHSWHKTLVTGPLLCCRAHGDRSLSPPRQAGHFPAPKHSARDHVVMHTLLAKEDVGAEVSKCALFLEGTLSKKCAEKWFGKRSGLEELRFSFGMINNGDGGKRSE